MKRPELTKVPTSLKAVEDTDKPDSVVEPQANAPRRRGRAAARSNGVAENAAKLKRTFTLSPEHVAFIESTALDEGQKRKKSMNSSEALRLIIDKVSS